MHITVLIGDDDQSIYSFKFANPEGIREWIVDNPGADDTTLVECRRCPEQVVEMANSLIAFNTTRPVRRTLTPMPERGRGDVRIIQYRSLDEEVAGIVQMIVDLTSDGVPAGDILVLAQRDVIGSPIYEGLLSNGIASRSYYAENELKKATTQEKFSLLKLFVDKEDKVALRCLLGSGKADWNCKSYNRLRQYCEANGGTAWEVLEKLENGTIRPIAYTAVLVSRFSEIKNQIFELENLLTASGMAGVVNHVFPANDPNVRDIRALALEVLTQEGLDRKDLLRELTTAVAKPEIPSEVAEVRIMSLHKSKGLSSPVTIIAGCVQGLLPKNPDSELSVAEQNENLEEQRRLFYVGITRVKSVPKDGKPGILILTYSQKMPAELALKAGIVPAGKRYGTVTLHASSFIQELGPSAPAPILG